jgi:hypothetical protein
MAVSGQHHTLAASPARKELQYPMNGGLELAAEPVRTVWKKRNISDCARIRTLHHPAHTLVTIPTTLESSRLYRRGERADRFCREIGASMSLRRLRQLTSEIVVLIYQTVRGYVTEDSVFVVNAMRTPSNSSLHIKCSSDKKTRRKVDVPLKDETCLLYIRTQCVPRCKHSPPRLYQTSLSVLYKAKVTVCSEIRTKHINAMWATFKNF